MLLSVEMVLTALARQRRQPESGQLCSLVWDPGLYVSKESYLSTRMHPFLSALECGLSQARAAVTSPSDRLKPGDVG